MKRKISTYIILIVAAILLAVIIVSRNRSPFGRRNTSFASYPGKEITAIEFIQGEKKLRLEKGEEEWLVNGSVPARKSSISFILRILLEMKIKSPVSPGTADSVIASVEPVRVRVFEDRKRINSFLVYKTPTNEYGNIMKTSVRAKPFIVHVPGSDNNIGPAFTLNELYWKPYAIFNLLPSEINRLVLEHTADTSGSFSISRENGGFALFSGERKLTGWDNAKLTRYLSYFTFIPFETWAFDLDETARQKIAGEEPAYIIRIWPEKSGPVILRLWERRNADGSVDTDRLYGKTENADQLFIVRYFDIDPILKKRAYFYSEN